MSNIVDGLGPGSGSVAICPAVPGIMSGVGSAALETAVVVLQILSFVVGKASKAGAGLLLLLLVVELVCHGVDSDGEGLDRGHEGAGGGVDTDVIDLHCHWIEGGGGGWG